MLFRSYNTNSWRVFRTPHKDPDVYFALLTESGSVYSDPTDKRVRFAKRVVFFDELVGGNCYCHSMTTMENCGNKCRTARYMARL